MHRARHLILLLLGLCTGAAHAGGFRLHVAGTDARGRLAPRFAYEGAGCHGDNTRPALSWQGPPAGTRSFAVTVFDPDAGAAGWWHWFVFDLPADANGVGTVLPAAARQLRNDYGGRGWGGPCPPPGPPHHYQFTVYALDVATLALDADTPPATALAALRAHRLAQARITVLFGR